MEAPDAPHYEQPLILAGVTIQKNINSVPSNSKSNDCITISEMDETELARVKSLGTSCSTELDYESKDMNQLENCEGP